MAVRAVASRLFVAAPTCCASLCAPNAQPNPTQPPPLLHTAAQVEHYLKNGLGIPMPRSNEATFKRAYKQRIEAVRSRSSTHIEWEPMEGAQ